MPYYTACRLAEHRHLMWSYLVANMADNPSQLLQPAVAGLAALSEHYSSSLPPAEMGC